MYINIKKNILLLIVILIQMLHVSCKSDNQLVLDESKYNGFSYTPKKKFGIFKIWFNDTIDKDNIMKDIDINLNINNALFKKYI